MPWSQTLEVVQILCGGAVLLWPKKCPQIEFSVWLTEVSKCGQHASFSFLTISPDVLVSKGGTGCSRVWLPEQPYQLGTKINKLVFDSGSRPSRRTLLLQNSWEVLALATFLVEGSVESRYPLFTSFLGLAQFVLQQIIQRTKPLSPLGIPPSHSALAPMGYGSMSVGTAFNGRPPSDTELLITPMCHIGRIWNFNRSVKVEAHWPARTVPIQSSSNVPSKTSLKGPGIWSQFSLLVFKCYFCRCCFASDELFNQRPCKWTLFHRQDSRLMTLKQR